MFLFQRKENQNHQHHHHHHRPCITIPSVLFNLDIQTDAHYDSQMKSHNRPTTQQNATFCGPAIQMEAGAGGLGAFVLKMGSATVLVVRKYIFPVAKPLRKICCT